MFGNSPSTRLLRFVYDSVHKTATHSLRTSQREPFMWLTIITRRVSSTSRQKIIQYMLAVDPFYPMYRVQWKYVLEILSAVSELLRPGRKLMDPKENLKDKYMAFLMDAM